MPRGDGGVGRLLRGTVGKNAFPMGAQPLGYPEEELRRLS